ncbi:MAG TPA: hypothetical protein VH394_02955 [Thermoanaerobaculia bacterium]|nr:hypothetical protein [Thermoanaerobaculia bacterium]
MKSGLLALAILALGGSLAVVCGTAPAAAPGPPTPTKSPVIPYQVPDHQTYTPEAARPFFDSFSWQSFVALNWPVAVASSGRPVRGKADTGKTIGDSGPPRVWETWKASWETFKKGGAAPSEWSSYDSTPPCNGVNAEGKVLLMVSKVNSVTDGINEAFSGPLIDQNRNYTRYEIRFNETEFNAIRNNQWYLRSKLPKDPTNPVNFASSVQGSYGAIEVKAAWRELVAGQDDFNRYYAVKGIIIEPGTPHTCRNATLGLVGLHIASKVDPFREWIWSTFEHVDNVPASYPPPAGIRYSFNDGRNVQPNPQGYDYQPANLPDGKPIPPIEQRKPVQVSRVTPIPKDTQAMNARYQDLLRGTVWQNYQLVATQWPTTVGKFKVQGNYPENSDFPFPAKAVANTALETYLQTQDCTSCHYMAAQTDFSFILDHAAYPPGGKALKALTTRMLHSHP